jgi:molybdenum cofactor guanylyltransferase
MNKSENAINDEITAVVLAGGASSRMGQPKALLPWRGARFIDHIVRQLREQAGTIAISSSDTDAFQSLQVPILADPFPDRRGPLAGMLAGLRFSTTPFTLFVPCDSPLIEPQLAAQLYAALTIHEADVAYASSSGNLHYLFALLRTPLDQSLADHLVNGDFAVRRWFATLRQIAVSFDEHDCYFVNINTPDALRQLQHLEL